MVSSPSYGLGSSFLQCRSVRDLNRLIAKDLAASLDGRRKERHLTSMLGNSPFAARGGAEQLFRPLQCLLHGRAGTSMTGSPQVEIRMSAAGCATRFVSFMFLS